MSKKSNLIRTSFVFLAIIGLLFASESQAFLYRPAEKVTILSEYAAFSDSAPPKTQVWRIVSEVSSDGSGILQFFQQSAPERGAVCTLRFPPFGSSGVISLKRIGKIGEKTSDTGLLLAPGFPAPCDVLPVGEEHEGRVYQERSEAGGSVFIRRYLISTDVFTFAEATEKGWIRGETPGISQLIMVAVTDEKGRLAVRQLWHTHGSWWMYEETPLRRSWRID